MSVTHSEFETLHSSKPLQNYILIQGLFGGLCKLNKYVHIHIHTYIYTKGFKRLSQTECIELECTYSHSMKGNIQHLLC